MGMFWGILWQTVDWKEGRGGACKLKGRVWVAGELSWDVATSAGSIALFILALSLSSPPFRLSHQQKWWGKFLLSSKSHLTLLTCPTSCTSDAWRPRFGSLHQSHLGICSSKPRMSSTLKWKRMRQFCYWLVNKARIRKWTDPGGVKRQPWRETGAIQSIARPGSWITRKFPFPCRIFRAWLKNQS